MSETIETTKTTVKNVEGRTTTYFEKIKTINTYWRNMPPNFKRFTISYFAITSCCYAVYNYNDGKNSLIQYRNLQKTKYPNVVVSTTEEWNAIKKGINSYDNFWDALFFPITLSSKIMPSIILLLNQDTKK